MLINTIFIITLIPFLGVSMKWLVKEMIKGFEDLED